MELGLQNGTALHVIFSRLSKASTFFASMLQIAFFHCSNLYLAKSLATSMGRQSLSSYNEVTIFVARIYSTVRNRMGVTISRGLENL